MPFSQRGFALLIILSLVILTFATALVSRLSVNALRQQRIVDNAEILGLAADALNGYALRQLPPNKFTLPCPDTTGDGESNTQGGNCSSQRGLLPVSTLGLGDLRDASGAELWYAVATSYVANAPAPRNASTANTLVLNGKPMAAVLIAPGIAINNQGRTALNATDFLEGINADGNLDQYADEFDDSHNDQLLGLPSGKFWALMSEVALPEAARLLAQYRATCGEYPWAAAFGGPYDSVDNLQAGALPLNSSLPTEWGALCGGGATPIPPAWLQSHWSNQIYYRMCTSGEGSCLSFVGKPEPAASAVLVAAGAALSGQTRPSVSLADHLDDENLNAPDNQLKSLDIKDHSATFNDTIRLLSP